MRVVETEAAQETEALGASIAALLAPGDVVHVRGELGSGKTTLVRGACRALGVEVAVTSPTFAIAHRYRGAGGVVVGHVDLYRLGGLAGEEPELLADYLGPDRITFVEWPLEGEDELGQPRLRILLEHLGGERRRIEVSE